MITPADIFSNLKSEKELYIELGRTLIAQNKFRKAISFLLDAKQIDGEQPETWGLYYLLGEAHKNINKPLEAAKYYIEAALHNHDSNKQCYEEARKLITLSTASDLSLWINDRILQIVDVPLQENDLQELDGLSKFCLVQLQQAQEPELFEKHLNGESQPLVQEADTLIKAHQYNDALIKIEAALAKESGNLDLVFNKIRILIEGQIDFDHAISLFSDEVFNERKSKKDKPIESDLEALIKANPKEGNVFFFSAFIRYLMGYEPQEIIPLVETAEKLGLQNENTYPNLGLFLLKGELAEESQDPQSAAKEFLEGAKCYYWQAQYAEANSYFKRVITLQPSLNEAYIYSADTLFLLSIQIEPPFNHESLINDAYSTWHASPVKVVTNLYDAWFYIVIARIHEVKFKFTAEDFPSEYWMAVLYAERAIVHDPEFFSYWVNLGRYYRNLDMESNSLHALKKAETLNPEDENLREEKIMTLLNQGEYDEPLAYLQQRKEKDTVYKSYLKSWEAYALFHKGQETEAIRLYNENIKEAPSDLYAHQMKMNLLWHLHQMGEAKKEAHEILQLENYTLYPKEEFTFSWAYFITGDTDKAIQLLENYNSRAHSNSENLFSLSQFYLYKGDSVKAIVLLDTFLKWTFNPRALNDLSKRLIALEQQYQIEKSESKGAIKEFGKTIKEWQQKIESKVQDIQLTPLSPLAELENKQMESNFQAGSVPHVTIQAGMARHYSNEQKLPEAYKIYQSILPFNSLFPEATIAIQKIEYEVYNKTFALIQESKFTEVVDYLEKFLINDFLNTPKANMLLSLAYYGLERYPMALKYLITCFNSPANDTYNQQVWSDLTDKAYHPQLTWGFGNFIKSSIEKYNIGDRKILRTQMTDNFWKVLINKENVLYPVVTPIAVEMSANLVPEEAYGDHWYVITELIPAMRQSIDERFGVKPPGVRIRGNEGDLLPDTYIIMMDEIPLVMGTVRPGKLYVEKSSEELQALSVSGEPLTSFMPGVHATWVNKEDKEKLNQNHIPFEEDYFKYILSHLAYMLAYSLDQFIDAQFCEYYLDLSGYEMKDQVLKNGLIEKSAEIKASSTMLIQLNEVLKALVREQVPILRKEIILPSFLEALKNNTEITDILQLLRFALKNELPLNKTILKRFELPVEVEKKIKDALMTIQGKTFLAMIPENCQDALAKIRNIVSNDPSPGSLLLLTKDSKLRVHLRKLVELEFPNLIVGAQEELLNT